MSEEPILSNKSSLSAPTDLETQVPEAEDPAWLQQIVEVQAEQMKGRQRRISAKIQIPAAVEQVWTLLTDYEALPNFIPNLAKSKRLEHPEGGLRLEQVGTQRLLRLNFSARVVLDMEEEFPAEIRFKMVEGDFKSFSGYWRLEPQLPVSSETAESGQAKPITNLLYNLEVCPKLAMPVKFIEHRICKDLRINLFAIRQQLVGVPAAG